MLEASMLNKNILLVEDDRSHREFVSCILESMGCKVSTAFDGEEAINLLQEGADYDLVLMDIELPRMNGMEATRIIRDMKRHGDIKDIPILAISSNQDEKTVQDCINSGMKGLIPKSLWKPKWEPTIKDKILEVLNSN